MTDYRIVPFHTDGDYFPGVTELYSTVFPEGTKSDIKDRLRRHSGYEGFKGLAAVAQEQVIGFAYGYTSKKGQFYNTKLRKALSKPLADQWLPNCYEFVELAVDSRFRRMGIATSLHDRLLEDLPHRTAILTTQVDNVAARTMYARKGWKVITEPFYPFDEPFVIMGKRM